MSDRHGEHPCQIRSVPCAPVTWWVCRVSGAYSSAVPPRDHRITRRSRAESDRIWLIEAPLAGPGITDLYVAHMENALTNVLAVTLRCHDELVRRLLSHPTVGLAISGKRSERFCVGLQHQLPDSRKTVDIAVEALAPNGRVLARLWIENKINSGEVRSRSGEQYTLEYLGLQAAEPAAKGRLVVIKRTPRDIRRTGRPAGFDVGVLTWAEIIGIVRETGVSAHGERWVVSARDPEAPARLRTLAECLWFLDMVVGTPHTGEVADL